MEEGIALIVQLLGRLSATVVPVAGRELNNREVSRQVNIGSGDRWKNVHER
jgi:hypothetical protein